ncbi:helix-turn-helix domain-containing protein [Streptomyces sp. ISL-11]|uniref:helix-turn-helix domain-containing protein n=1 Tax=Streptomyces sp. ISL-11 TaxID=2819174 RepID=UPI002035A911|nr:helix-turn-helix domain-containing protein [Streptomyces sp. ISL-11]
MTQTTEVVRAFRFALDPTAAQVAAFKRHAGAARWAFNHALGVKIGAHRQWRGDVDALVAGGITEKDARKTARLELPKKLQIQKHLNAIKVTTDGSRYLRGPSVRTGRARGGTRWAPTPSRARSRTLTRRSRTGWTPSPGGGPAARSATPGSSARPPHGRPHARVLRRRR